MNIKGDALFLDCTQVQCLLKEAEATKLVYAFNVL